MSANNMVHLIGRLTKEPKGGSTSRGTISAEFTLAVQKPKKQQTENDTAYFHRCMAFGVTAKVILDYVRKGEQIAVDGKLVSSKYTDSDSGKTIYSTTVFVDDVYFLGTKKSSDNKSSTDEQHGEIDEIYEMESFEDYNYELPEDGVAF